MNGNVVNCKEKYCILEIITEQIFLRVARKYCQLNHKIMWVSKIIMEIVETILLHSVHASYFLCDVTSLNYVRS